jgi:hypothetical protein
MKMTTDKAYVKAARRLHQKQGEVEIDDNAIVSRGSDKGAYVHAWVWVPAAEVEK